MKYVRATGFLLAAFIVYSAGAALLFGPLFLLGLWWLPVPLAVMFSLVVYCIADNFA